MTPSRIMLTNSIRCIASCSAASSSMSMSMSMSSSSSTAAIITMTSSRRRGGGAMIQQQQRHHFEDHVHITTLTHKRGYATSKLQNQIPPATSSSSSQHNLQEPPSIPTPTGMDSNYGTYSSPVMHTIGIAGRLFRYSVYGSVAIILSGTAAYLSLHAYVEYIALHGWSRIPVNESQLFLPEELVPAFSGAHRGGGTDPSLSWRARAAARSAWIALNISDGGLLANGTSTARDVAVPDKAWLEAEGYFKLAIQEAEKALENGNNNTSLDAIRELKFQLATILGKLGGPRGLREAWATYEDLLSTASLPSSSVLILSPAETARWIELQRRLSDVKFRLGSLDKSGAAATRQATALSQLDAALQEVLGSPPSSPSTDTIPPPTPAIAALEAPKPKSSFSFANLWSSNTEASSDSVTASSEPITSNVTASLANAARTLAAPAQRALGRALLDEVTLLAQLRQLSQAKALCDASLEHLRQASSRTTGSDLENNLHKISISTQVVLLQCYLAELLAAQKGSRQPSSLTTSKTDTNTRNILNEAVDTALSSITQLKRLEKASNDPKKHIFSQVSTSIRASADQAASLAHATRALLAEVKDKDYMSALQDYEAANSIANALKTAGKEQNSMHTKSLEGIRRCREKLLLNEA